MNLHRNYVTVSNVLLPRLFLKSGHLWTFHVNARSKLFAAKNSFKMGIHIGNACSNDGKITKYISYSADQLRGVKLFIDKTILYLDAFGNHWLGGRLCDFHLCEFWQGWWSSAFNVICDAGVRMDSFIGA